MMLQLKFTRVLQPLAWTSAAGVAFSAAVTLAQAPPAEWDSGRPAFSPHEPERLPVVQPNIRPIAPAGDYSLTAGQAIPPASPQQGQKSDVQRQLELLYQQNGRPMPQMVNPGMVQVPSAAPQQPQYRTNGVPSSAQHYAQPAGQQQHGPSAHEPESDNIFAGFFGRMKQTFNTGRPSKGPPVDPGMTYPTASQQQRGMVPPATRGNIPAPVPGVPSSQLPAIPPIVSSGMQPGLLNPPSTANPIQNPQGGPLIPPSPGVVSAPAAQPQLPAIQPAPPVTGNGLADMPRQIPELKAIMDPTPKAPQAPAPAPETTTPPAVAGNSSLPVLDFNAPLPEPAATAAPGEPTEEPKTATVPPGPAVEKDPFENLFPDDAPASKQPALAVTPNKEPAKVESETAEESPTEPAETAPYTGLTLEDDLFEASKSSDSIAKKEGTATTDSAPIPPAPGLEVPTRTASITKTPELKMDRAPALMAPPAPDDIPALDLTVRKEPTRIASLTNPRITPSLPKSDEMSKMERIAARKDLKGLKGFCPVALRDERDLVDASSEYSVIFNGARYEFSDEEAMETFLNEPTKYAPAARGHDVIHLALTNEELEGSLDYAVWYKGRLYLFCSVETMETFVAAPSSHATTR